MKIGINRQDARTYNAIAAQMIANGATITEAPDGFKVILAGSDDERERAATPGRLFYSFEVEGKCFHLSFD